MSNKSNPPYNRPRDLTSTGSSIYNFLMKSGDMIFHQVGLKKKSVQVAEQIIEAIQRGLYKIGDKLPPERVIEQETGVSKSSVREALSALHLAGIVERVPGSGTYVRDSAEGFGALALLEESESVEDALDARKLIEQSIVELAIDRASEKQIDEIESIWERLRIPLKEKDYEDFFYLNEKFHLAIAAATGNPLIVKVIRLLLGVTHQKLWKQTITEYFLKDEAHFQQSIEEHRQILLSLRVRDRKLAKKVMEEHFIAVERILREG